MRRTLAVLGATTILLAGAGCAGVASDGAAGGRAPSDPVEVSAVATVLQRAEDPAPALCLGGVAESYPPQCGGPEIVGWDWDAIAVKEEAGGVIWGQYAVRGEWDGERFTIAEAPIPLALYDPPAAEEPGIEEPGPLDEAASTRIGDELAAELGRDFLWASTHDGRVEIAVVFDDGRLAAELAERYGEGAVVVVSALAPVAG